MICRHSYYCIDIEQKNRALDLNLPSVTRVRARTGYPSLDDFQHIATIGKFRSLFEKIIFPCGFLDTSKSPQHAECGVPVHGDTAHQSRCQSPGRQNKMGASV